MTRKIPKWKVTVYYYDPDLHCRRNRGRVYSAHTPSGAVVQSLVKWPYSDKNTQATMRTFLYKVEVERAS